MTRKCEKCHGTTEVKMICMKCLDGLAEFAIKYQRDPGDLSDLK